MAAFLVGLYLLLAQVLTSRLSDLKLDGVVLAATHTHSSLGGFDSRVLAQVVGTGRFRREAALAVVDRAEVAVRQAEKRLVAVGLRTAEARLAGR